MRVKKAKKKDLKDAGPTKIKTKKKKGRHHVRMVVKKNNEYIFITATCSC